LHPQILIFLAVLQSFLLRQA